MSLEVVFLKYTFYQDYFKNFALNWLKKGIVENHKVFKFAEMSGYCLGREYGIFTKYFTNVA